MKTKLINSLLVISFVAMTIFGCGTNVKAVETNKTTVKVIAVKETLKEPEINRFNLMEKFDKKRKELTPDKVKRELDERKKTEEIKKLNKPETIQEKIKVACEEYGIDYNITLAIARLETGHFTSDAYKYRNNPGGLSKNEVPMRFETIEEGVDRFVKNLKVGYFDRGLDTVREIGKKYCPVNPNWANLVEQIMEMN